MFTILFITLALLAAAGTILIKKKKNAVDIIETIILFMLLCNVGLGGLFAFAGHTLMADQVATRIGWPAGSPFQFEVAVANLSLSVLGILSIWFRQNFWLATSIAYAVFLLGAAAGHIREMLVNRNFSDYNTGALIYIGDILIPLALLVLIIIHRRLQHKG
jgi:hypothetical protein